MNFKLSHRSGVSVTISEQKNAVTSMQHISVAFGVLGLVCLLFGAGLWQQIIGATLMSVPLIIFVGMNIYFMIKSPERLQSEKHIQQMAMIEQGMIDAKTPLTTDTQISEHAIKHINTNNIIQAETPDE